MRRYIHIIYCAVMALFLASCAREIGLDEPVPAPGRQSGPELTAALSIEGSVPRSPIATKALVDRITTRQLNSNFLRLDEDITDTGDALGTYRSGESCTTTMYYPKGYILMAAAIASPDNTVDNLRSVTFNPAQAYRCRVKVQNQVKDTINFYHTRMIGWYPRTCNLAIVDGDAVVEQFETEYEKDAYELDPASGRVAIKFSNLRSSDDLMVSDLCEAQQWHSPLASLSPHAQDAQNLPYRMPFGANADRPGYANFFTYRHYRSAVMLFAEADNSPQNLAMWGDIKGVTLANQPTACKVWLPENVGDFGTCVWDETSRTQVQIDSTEIFGDDSNHADIAFRAHYPISLEGATHSRKAYLGYALIEPDHDLTVQIHTTSGVYSVTVPHTQVIEGNPVEVFKPSYYYTLTLNLQTTGAIADFLEAEDEDVFYDLTTIRDINGVIDYPYANCYIVDPDSPEVMAELTRYNTEHGTSRTEYDGYTFSATTIGNGDAGILNASFYPQTAEIEPYTARLIWESPADVVHDIELVHEYVRFKHAKTDPEGNAVVGVFDRQNRLQWCWHLWFTDTPSATPFGSATFMDRNLGATFSGATTAPSNANEALETYGLYYQWGRKDPSMGPPRYNYPISCLITAPYYDYTSETLNAAEVKQYAAPTLQNALDNPMYLILPSAPLGGTYSYNWMSANNTLLWGYNTSEQTIHKSLYDPCPFGYRVPAGELKDALNGRTASVGTYGSTYTDASGNKMFIPYAGFKGDDANSNTVTCAWMDVGSQGDLQTARISTSNYHRERVYVSKVNNWSHLVGDHTNSYSSNTVFDYTNRRTATSVRCVRDTDFGAVSAQLTYSSALGVSTLTQGDQLSFLVNANANGYNLNSVRVDLSYVYDGDPVNTTVYSYVGSPTVNVNEPFVYDVTQDIDRVSAAGFTFTLTAVNTNGKSVTSVVQIKNPGLNLRSITVTDPHGNFDETDHVHPFKGQQYRLSLDLTVRGVSCVWQGATINTNTNASAHTITNNGNGTFNVHVEYLTNQPAAGRDIEIPLAVMLTVDGEDTQWHYTYQMDVWDILDSWRVGSALTTVSAVTNATYGVVIVNKSSVGNYLAGSQSGIGFTNTFDNTGVNKNVWWTVSGTYIFQNVSTGNYIGRQVLTPNFGQSSATYSMEYRDGYFLIYYSSNGIFGFGKDTYFLKKSGSGIVLESKENKDYQWIIYPIERDATRYINPRG